MSQIQSNFDLTPLNTFKVPAIASHFLILNSLESLKSLQSLNSLGSPLVLGEGANILFTKNYEGLIIKNELKGKKILSEKDESITVELGAGENWHDFVMWSVENGYSGIENLALIPGTVGASPVQNLAAYGQNVGEIIESVKGFFLNSPTPLTTPTSLTTKDCRFFYRDSIFKHDLKDKFLITSVTFKLSKTAHYDTSYHSRYESLKGELSLLFPNKSNLTSETNFQFSPKQISQAVISLRQKKLPDWKKLPTAGSFFKNPFVTKAKFAQLVQSDKSLQAYPINAMLYPNPDDPVFKMSNMVKIPAGRLLDRLGWRCRRIGNVGTFERHALVVVNYGSATGQEILAFTQKMQEDVKKNFGIELEPEVNIL